MSTVAKKSDKSPFGKFAWANGSKGLAVHTEEDRCEVRAELKSLANIIRQMRNRKKPAEMIAAAEHLRDNLINRLAAAAQSTLGRYTRRGQQISDAAVSCAASMEVEKPRAQPMKRPAAAQSTCSESNSPRSKTVSALVTAADHGSQSATGLIRKEKEQEEEKEEEEEKEAEEEKDDNQKYKKRNTNREVGGKQAGCGEGRGR